MLKQFHAAGVTDITESPLPEIIKRQVTVLSESSSLDEWWFNADENIFECDSVFLTHFTA